MRRSKTESLIRRDLIARIRKADLLPRKAKGREKPRGQVEGPAAIGAKGLPTQKEGDDLFDTLNQTE